MNAEQAKSYVTDYSIPVNENFFSLTSGDIESVLKAAEVHRYKRPKNSPGSKARSFYKELMRHFKGELK